jgi:hypothetical protein
LAASISVEAVTPPLVGLAIRSRAESWVVERSIDPDLAKNNFSKIH